ncbi:glutamate-cysteine ligase family protein [Enterobacter hormaechei]
MPLPDFKSSEPYTLGIELNSRWLTRRVTNLTGLLALIAAVKDDIKGGEVKHDITESMLEIATGVCQTIDQAAAQFSVMQQSILRAAAEHHIQICGGGTHPFQKWQRQEVCDDERYNVTLERFGYLILQATVFGQHVHVGCRTGTTVVYCTACRASCRTLTAMAAASPYMQGTDTKFASSRLNIFSASRITDRCRRSTAGRSSRGCSAA